MNANDVSSRANEPIRNSPLVSVADALAVVPDEQWRDLAQFAEYLLRRMRQDPRKAAYLAGVSGEDIVGTAVLAVQIGANSAKNGRKVKNCHLQDGAQFLRYMRSAIKSTVDNFRRHRAGQSTHLSITGEINPPDTEVDLVDPKNVERDIVIRDLLEVIIREVSQDLEGSPKRAAILHGWIDSLYHDEILPTNGHSKFLGYHVRAAIRKQLRKLAEIEVGIENPTGKELLS